MREDAVLFGEMKSLVGIVTDPPEEKGNHHRPAVILLNAGMVHRVGPGGIHVKIARTLAAMGFVVLRFDFSGIGDSAVRHDNLPFDKSTVRETQAAMDFLQATRGVGQFILMGGCSGARISLQAACCDPRVIGALPINLPVPEDDDGNPDQIHRSTAYYYWRFAIFNLESWRKLVTGKVDFRRIFRTLKFQVRCRLTSKRKVSSESLQFAANLRLLANRGVQLAFVYSESDSRLNDLYEAVRGALEKSSVPRNGRIEIIPRSDHTFSALSDQEGLLKKICELIAATATATLSNQLDRSNVVVASAPFDDRPCFTRSGLAPPS